MGQPGFERSFIIGVGEILKYVISDTGITGFQDLNERLHYRTELDMGSLAESSQQGCQKQHSEKRKMLYTYISIVTFKFPQLTMRTNGRAFVVLTQDSMGCPQWYPLCLPNKYTTLEKSSLKSISGGSGR